MIIEFSAGKIIATQHEVVVRIIGEQMVMLQAQPEAIQLFANGSNVVVANGSECKWSIKLDDEEQLLALSQVIGIACQ